MTNRAPERAHSGVRHRVKALVRRALEDLHVSHDCVAAAADVSRQRIERQLDAAHDAQPPLYLLAVLPDEVSERVVAALRAMRRPTPARPAEHAGARLLARAGAAVAEIGKALEDGRITSLEMPEVRRRVAELRRECDSMLHTFGAVQDDEGAVH